MQKHCANSIAKKLTLVVIIFFLSIAIICPLQSCTKNVGGPHDGPFSRSTFLIAEKWSLTSSTSIDSLSSGTRVSYKGAPVDSINFAWALDPNVDIYGINSYIGGINTHYSISRIGANVIVSSEDTVALKYDTVMLATPWKQGYSDTLFVTKTSPTQLVFNVRYALPTGSGVEVDSFRSIGHY